MGVQHLARAREVLGRVDARARPFGTDMNIDGEAILFLLALGPASYSLGEVLGALLSPDSAAPQVRVVLARRKVLACSSAVMIGRTTALQNPC